MKLQNLKTNYLGINATFYESIDSTQKEIWRKIENKTIKNGELIVAQIQTSGIGTYGRTWHTSEENNIAFSFFIKANCEIKKLRGFTKEIAEIIVEVFKEKYDVKLEIKEPNDIVFQGKKIGGILTETKCQGEIVKYIIVGIGMNTNQQNFSEEIKDIATSIKNEFQIEIDNLKVISEFCNKIETKIKKRMGENNLNFAKLLNYPR